MPACAAAYIQYSAELGQGYIPRKKVYFRIC